MPTDTNTEATKSSLRRNRSDLTLLSLVSESSSDSSQSDLSTRPHRRTRNKRKKQKKEPEDLVAKAVAEMNITPEEESKYIALDCEMVGTGYRGKYSALARVTMVDWNHNIVLDEFVKPEREVTDYRTFVSGITAEMLEQTTTIDLETCREKVLKTLEGKILVGHGLKNDMRALGIHLPWQIVRDTAKFEPYMKARFDDGVLWPQSLKNLAKNRMRRDVQIPGQAHCPVEDAATAMDLYKLARRKWEKAMDYKISKTRAIQEQKQ